MGRPSTGRFWAGWSGRADAAWPSGWTAGSGQLGWLQSAGRVPGGRSGTEIGRIARRKQVTPGTVAGSADTLGGTRACRAGRTRRSADSDAGSGASAPGSDALPSGDRQLARAHPRRRQRESGQYAIPGQGAGIHARSQQYTGQCTCQRERTHEEGDGEQMTVGSSEEIEQARVQNLRSGVERRLQQVLLFLQPDHDLAQISILQVTDLLCRL